MPSDIRVREQQMVMTNLMKENMINIENLMDLGSNIKNELTPDDLRILVIIRHCLGRFIERETSKYIIQERSRLKPIETGIGQKKGASEETLS